MKLEKVLPLIFPAIYWAGFAGSIYGAQAVQNHTLGGEPLLYLSETAVILSGGFLFGSLKTGNNSNYQDY
ncbi:Uncharacterised protein [uncultured archaeon]|nr:Uncharacterised protein [uncultured archaeon]